MRRLQQQGVALISVLLITSLLTTLAAQMLSGLWTATDKTRHYQELAQARLYARGAEQFVALMLEQDYQADRQNQQFVDHAGESWNLTEVDYDIAEGQIDITVNDEQGLFNLNSLAAHDTIGVQSLQIFKNLLRQQDIAPNKAERVKDWVDRDMEVSPGGAEDQHYLGLEPPRRVANTDMVSVSEIPLVSGLGEQEAQALSQLVVTISGTTRININTAPRGVLLALSSQLSSADAEAIIQARTAGGLSTLSDLLSLPTLAGKAEILQAAPLTFHSQHFSAIIRVRYRSVSYQTRTWFYRSENGSVQIRHREIGPSQYWPDVLISREWEV